MQCPVCDNTKLAIAERQGIEIDYCPECRGVWLDRGELDKIIERSNEDAGDERREGSGFEDTRDPAKGKKGKKSKKSMLSELLDF